MSDLIERQKAIDALGECPVGDTDWDLGCRNQWEWDTEILRTLPSAEPERKKGEWIYDTERVAGDGWTYSQYHCSECGFQELGGLANFCSHCGAEMTR